jgi:1-acyl-sn-glycerol-3-phosphate acyltransferase
MADRAGGSRIRFARRVATLVGWLLFCLAGHGIARLTGGRLRWVRRFLGGTAAILGADVRVRGTPLDRDVLFVANHLSWLDIPAMGGATGTAFVSKDAVADWPVVGRLAAMADTVFIARTSRAAAGGQTRAIAATLAGGRPVTLFPEGTTDDGVTVLPFRSALFAAAMEAGVRVQPVAIDYGDQAPVIAWGPDEPATAVARRLIGRRGRLPILLHFLPPLDPALGRKALATTAHAAIVACLAGRDGAVCRAANPL